MPTYIDPNLPVDKINAKDIISDLPSIAEITMQDSGYLNDIYHGNNLFTRSDFRNTLYNGTFRFGNNSLIHEALGVSCKEYLFFTKPNLNIYTQDDSGNTAGSTLNPALKDMQFWKALDNGRKEIIKSLEWAASSSDPFIHLLQNTVSSNLEIPGLDAEMIDTPSNMYGISYSYRGSSESSDDNPEFSLEFKDTKYLDVYHFFKAYEEYETLKHHGVIAPAQYYILNKILHDQFAIYKFIVDEDGETILYYGKMYGVTPKSLPRDVFGNPNFENGLSYSVNFKAAFYEDMKPEILGDFNALSGTYFNSLSTYLSVYDVDYDRPDTRVGKAAAIFKDSTSATAQKSPTGFVYKLKWKGDS